MEIKQNLQQPQLPPIVKGSATYKMYVPKKVEEKIRYLIRKYPSTEWSGVLFYNYKGNFDKGTLAIYCQDIFPMDLGTSTATSFNMDENVVGYIAQNIELFGCETGIIHSHHSIGAFLSGTDIASLKSDGNETNCFVSLVVDTKGTYVAAITRKIQRKTEVTKKSLGTSYQFFGEGEVKTDEDPMSETTQVVDEEVIEYFMLDIEVEKVDNPLEYLDRRFEEIEEKKKPVTSDWQYKHTSSFWDDTPSYCREGTLFPKEEMEEMITLDGWYPDQRLIHGLVCQMVACSLIIDTAKFDLKQWITVHMKKKYDAIFESADSMSFRSWSDFIVDFMLLRYDINDIPMDLIDDDTIIMSRMAAAMIEDLEKYPSNDYIKQYTNILSEYIYE